MADTLRADFPDQSCSDCGENKVIFKHWGELTPDGVTGYFCPKCLEQRKTEKSQGLKPKALATVC